MVTGNCYLVGFNFDQAMETLYIEEKVWGLTASMEVIAGVAHQHLQKA